MRVNIQLLSLFFFFFNQKKNHLGDFNQFIFFYFCICEAISYSYSLNHVYSVVVTFSRSSSSLYLFSDSTMVFFSLYSTLKTNLYFFTHFSYHVFHQPYEKIHSSELFSNIVYLHTLHTLNPYLLL